MACPPAQCNCPFLIMCMVSIPPMRIRALQNDLKPIIGRVIRFTARWSCSTMLFRYLDWRIRMSTQAPVFTLSMAAVLAPLLSMVTYSGKSCRLMARSRKRRAAAISRLAVSRKSTVSPSWSAALQPRSPWLVAQFGTALQCAAAPACPPGSGCP